MPGNGTWGDQRGAHGSCSQFSSVQFPRFQSEGLKSKSDCVSQPQHACFIISKSQGAGPVLPDLILQKVTVAEEHIVRCNVRRATLRLTRRGFTRDARAPAPDSGPCPPPQALPVGHLRLQRRHDRSRRSGRRPAARRALPDADTRDAAPGGRRAALHGQALICMYIYIYILCIFIIDYIHINNYMYMHICISLSLSISLSLYIYMYIYIYIYIYMYIQCHIIVHLIYDS